MGVYNWIQIEAVCPICFVRSRIMCQTHVASSASGDDTGRFCDREYSLGQKMAWWPPGHKKFSDWRVNGRIGEPLQGDVDWECCHSDCTNCSGRLFVVIRFEAGPVPVEVEMIGPLDQWPPGFN